jgi:gentisate 1,2-dioxygenase
VPRFFARKETNAFGEGRARSGLAAERCRAVYNDRVFVRGITGDYSLKEELKKLRAQPRVRKGAEIEPSGGPQHWNVDYMSPGVGIGQTLHIHLQEFAPGGVSNKHGHVNEAVFYILDGEGVEEHDGVKYEWEAGDIVVVHNNCVHQHANRSQTKPARTLVMKTKPMYMFMNMLFQKRIKSSPNEPTPNGVGYVPRRDSTA